MFQFKDVLDTKLKVGKYTTNFISLLHNRPSWTRIKKKKQINSVWKSNHKLGLCNLKFKSEVYVWYM